MRPWQRFAAAMCWALALGGACAQAQRLDGAGPSWAPAPAINPLPGWYEVRGGAWRVPRDMVDDMVARLAAAGGATMAAGRYKYIVQYQGEERAGVRSVRVMGGCRVDVRIESALSERFYQVFDGGKCYFDATYDPAAGQFSDFRYHGVG